MAPQPPYDGTGAPRVSQTVPQPTSAWTHAELDEWAAKQVPPIVYPSEVTTKDAKLQYIAARMRS